MNNDNQEERYLIDCIEIIRRDYEKQIRPYVDRLIKIRSLRPMPPTLLVRDVFNEVRSTSNLSQE